MEHQYLWNASPTRWMWFALSGIVGLAIGDAFLFQGYILVGPRITTLFMASVPVISTIFGMVFFHENLMLSGVGWYFGDAGGNRNCIIGWKEQPGSNGISEKDHNRNYLLGIGCGIGAALGQAIGLALSKNGLTGGFPSLSGTLMRMISAFAVIWLIALFTGKARSSLQETSQQPKGLIAIILGSIVGPFLGVWTSMIATQSEMLGISATLMSLTPVFVLPFVYFIFKERVSKRAIAGTVVALIGISILLTYQSRFFRMIREITPL